MFSVFSGRAIAHEIREKTLKYFIIFNKEMFSTWQKQKSSNEYFECLACLVGKFYED